MKLYITTPSPFARKVRIVAHEKGLADRIEEISVDPYANAPELLATNPVVQVPTLIAEYLDMIGSGPRLLPVDGAERLRVKRLETLANATLEMGVKLVLEKRRAEAERSPSWMDRWTFNMGRSLDALEAAAPSAEDFNMGVLSAGITVSWVSFRHPDYDWKTGRPNLVALQAALEQRPSFQATTPV